MAAVELTGRLNMLMALIDWRDETARCTGVFRSEEHGALEVEYRVHLDEKLLDLLARSFLKAGLPVIRGSVASTPEIKLVGETLGEFTSVRTPVQKFNMTGQQTSGPTKVDRRKTWRTERQERTAEIQQSVNESRAEEKRLAESVITGGNGNGNE